MNKHFKIFFSFWFLLRVSVHAQFNLVLNPSFENIKYCPNNTDEAYLALEWNQHDSLKRGTCVPELLASCAPAYNASVPISFGVTYQYARTGKNIMLVLAFNNGFSYDRDYLHGHLSNVLQNGKQYCITYYANLANTTGTALTKFGLYLDDGKLDTLVPCTNFTVTPQIDNTGSLLSDTLKWMKIEGVYIASGIETNVTIGNFNADNNCGAAVVYPTVGNVNTSYYLIDDISIIPTDLTPYAGRDTSITLGDSTYIGRPSEVGLDDDCFWYVPGNSAPFDTVAGLWIKPSTLGAHSYVVEQNICGAITYDTVNVSINPVGIEQQEKFAYNVKVYPNPANEILNIEFVGILQQEMEISISEVLGTEMKRQKIKDSKNTINISGMESGVYFVRIKAVDFTATKKIIIQH